MMLATTSAVADRRSMCRLRSAKLLTSQDSKRRCGAKYQSNVDQRGGLRSWVSKPVPGLALRIATVDHEELVFEELHFLHELESNGGHPLRDLLLSDLQLWIVTMAFDQVNDNDASSGL